MRRYVYRTKNPDIQFLIIKGIYLFFGSYANQNGDENSDISRVKQYEKQQRLWKCLFYN